MNTKLYVGNLSFKASEDELNSLFSEHGTVTDIFIVKDKFTDRSKGFAFVTMDQLNDFMDLESVPVHLRELARKQTYYRFEHPKVYNNKDYVLEQLSDTMKEKIMYSSYGEILKSLDGCGGTVNDIVVEPNCHAWSVDDFGEIIAWRLDGQGMPMQPNPGFGSSSGRQ